MDFKLLPDEKVVLESKTHWAMLAGPPGNIILGALFIFFTLRAMGSAEGAWSLVLLCFNLAGYGLILTGISSLWSIISHPRTEILLTDKRFIAKSGLFLSNLEELSLSQLTGVGITQHVIGTLFGYGTVNLSIGKKQESFFNLAQAEKIKEQINSMIAVKA